MTYRNKYVKKKYIMALCKKLCKNTQYSQRYVSKYVTTNNIATVILTTNTSYSSQKLLQGLRVNVIHYFYLIVSKKTHDENWLYRLVFIWYLKSTLSILEFARKVFFQKIVWAFENNEILN